MEKGRGALCIIHVTSAKERTRTSIVGALVIGATRDRIEGYEKERGVSKARRAPRARSRNRLSRYLGQAPIVRPPPLGSLHAKFRNSDQ